MTRKTSVEIDEDLLREVQEVLSTKTIRETVESAFLEVLRHQAQLDEIRALSEMKDLELDDPDVMGGAWRS